ncbi:MAG: MFS transporter [Clostridium sp.]|uniref:MFS transporter n=1 Tax=Clostridium sp. TaxID=1506 RepID=UPI0025BCB01C|nr:MFS transporter [Clostridium sp.]MCH3964772.1 MFS transporter [Clostridium sp.]MCI1715243.1 MFS transporter [Clostridium sp.]MCI1799505.1 MFS transporter [Clostridium sp.]MCI1813426.1 MFS transporter [Clostridium sp.]MCI1870317.1 MFS transporter [Clostridium sp.]
MYKNTISPNKISHGLLVIMSLICCITVANLYYNQPLLGDIARSFNASSRDIGLVSTLTQIGYGTGMLFIIPLGDIKERRNLILKLLIILSVFLALFSLSPNITCLIITSFMIGFTTVIPQLIIPFAAELSNPEERGKILGSVFSGLFAGILLARTISGFIGSLWGWKAMYYIASICTIILFLIVARFLPRSYPKSEKSYTQTMFSLINLIKNQPVLREASLNGAMMFGTFSIFWTTLIFFLESPAYHLGSKSVGLFALLGISSIIASPIVGRISDKKGAKFIVGISTMLSILAFIILLILGYKLWGIALGLILLDLGTQSAQVGNQTRVQSLSPEFRNRLNTIFMVSYFLGGALGSFIGTYSWTVFKWNGVCISGLVFLTIAILHHIFTIRKI